MSSRRSSSPGVVLEGTLTIPILTHTDNDQPAAADAAPTYVIRSAAGLASGSNLKTGTSSAISGVTGGYYISVAIGAADSFAAGSVYHMLITYAISSTTYKEWIDFPVH